MNQRTLHHTLPHHPTRLEIRHHRQKFYAVLSVDNQTLGVTESFNTPAAANMAGHALQERYEHNLRAASVF